MKKFLLDLRVVAVEHLNSRYILLRLTDDQPLPDMKPGQFVEVRIDHSPTTFLRRPISINFVDRKANELWLLVATVGDGTRSLAELKAGDWVNCLLPLGNGFTQPTSKDEKILLVGGGVGVAPLLFFGKLIKDFGAEVSFLLGARSAKDLLELDNFKAFGRVFITTEDGSLGEKGLVTNHSILSKESFTRISMCGPTPMMKAMARLAKKLGAPCEASLENMMACGLGACLCCVEKTIEGNLRVCQDGPVFDVNKLLW